MHPCELVELAAVVAVNGPLFVKHGRIYSGALEQYWISARARSEEWHHALQAYSETRTQQASLASHDASLVLAWRTIRPVIEEILLSEVLTRIWTAVATAHDQHRAADHATAVVRSVFLAHQEARHRALNVMIYGRGFSTQEAVALNQLRRRCERWCDMLLAYAGQEPTSGEYAFEPERVAEFARDLQEQQGSALRAFHWQVVLSALRGAFRPQVDQRDRDQATHHSRRLAGAILGCLSEDAFDSLGVLRSVWIDRMQHLADDTQVLLDDLLAINAPQPAGRLGRADRALFHAPHPRAGSPLRPTDERG